MRESFVELGIIVRSVRAGDYDARLAIFTANGIKWLAIKGVYRPKARFSSSIGIFTVAEFSISGSTIVGINVLVQPYTIAKDINRYYLACAIADSLITMEFIEQSPNALLLAIDAVTELSESDKSCYLIFIDYFSKLLEVLGYKLEFTFERENLSHTNAKKIVKSIIEAYLINADYKIQFCDMMY